MGSSSDEASPNQSSRLGREGKALSRRRTYSRGTVTLLDLLV